MQVNFHDVGSYLAGGRACQHTAATAAGSGDNAYIDGDIFDLQAFANQPKSAALIAIFEAALQEDETLSLKTKVEHGDESDLSDAAVYSYDGAEVDHGVVATGDTGGSTEGGGITRSVDLRGIKRYFRFSVHQDLSASGTDTNQLMAAVGFFSGACPAETLPNISS